MLDTTSIATQAAPGHGRPPLFSRKTQGSDTPGTRELRLLLNKLTPSSQAKLMPSLLALEFTPDLVTAFQDLLLTKVSDLRPPAATLKTFAECCLKVREKLQGDLGDCLVVGLSEKLGRAVKAVEAAGEEKLGSLIGLAGALAATGFSPGVWLFQTLSQVLASPSEVAVEAVCLVYRNCVREVLALEDVLDLAAETMDRLAAIWSESRFSKKTQFHIQNLLDSREELLTPAPPKPDDGPELVRKPSNRPRKKVTFIYPPDPSDNSPSTIDSPPESAAKSCVSPITRSFISSNTKVSPYSGTHQRSAAPPHGKPRHPRSRALPHRNPQSRRPACSERTGPTHVQVYATSDVQRRVPRRLSSTPTLARY